MFNKILCPTDFSEGSTKAMHWADHLAQKFHGRIVLLHVTPLPEPNMIAGDFDVSQELSAQSLQVAAKKLKSTNEVMLSSGEPWYKIVSLASDLECNGIVMGTQGLTSASHKLFGSTAENVVREANIPVMTVGPRCIAAEESVRGNALMPVSSLEEPLHNQVVFRKILREMNARPTLMHVVDYRDPIFEFQFHVSPLAVLDVEAKDRTVHLKKIAQRLSGDLAPQDLEARIRFGDIADQVLQEADPETFEMILMEVRKRTFISQFTNSNAYRILCGSRIPVVSIMRNHERYEDQ